MSGKPPPPNSRASPSHSDTPVFDQMTDVWRVHLDTSRDLCDGRLHGPRGMKRFVDLVPVAESLPPEIHQARPDQEWHVLEVVTVPSQPRSLRGRSPMVQ